MNCEKTVHFSSPLSVRPLFFVHVPQCMCILEASSLNITSTTEDKIQLTSEKETIVWAPRVTDYVETISENSENRKLQSELVHRDLPRITFTIPTKLMLSKTLLKMSAFRSTIYESNSTWGKMIPWLGSITDLKASTTVTWCLSRTGRSADFGWFRPVRVKQTGRTLYQTSGRIRVGHLNSPALFRSGTP